MTIGDSLNRRDALIGVGALAAIASSSTAFAAPQDIEIGTDPNTIMLNVFEPIEPKEVLKVKHVVNDQLQEDFYASLKEDNIRKLLGIQNARISICQVTASGKLQYMTGSLTAEKGNYVVLLDYGRFRDEDVTSNGKVIGRGRVGVGLRLKASLSTAKAGLDVGSLLPISANVSAGKMSGTIESAVIGIVNPRVSDLIQLPTQINEQSITKAVESMGAMKVLVDATETSTVPHLLAVSLIQAGTKKEEVVKSLT